jgi:sterol desaturase/sphingolipid hydroxylase (fatty acid hydroxylase superfamily)
MPVDPLLYATPLFAVALVAEGVSLHRRRKAGDPTALPYTVRDTMSALGCTALDQLTQLTLAMLFVATYDAVHLRVAAWSPSWRSVGWWAVALVAHDLAYYVWHRASHRITWLWAAHVVHHQPSRYDLTVSLRQGAVATATTYGFYLPLAFVVPTPMFVTVHAVYQVWQFFVHAAHAPSLGVLDTVLATPTHHRVHHIRAAEHHDHNYGGVFIVFDRLFGTFARAEAPLEYGVTGGFERASPLFANTYLFARLLDASRRVEGLRGLLALWLGPPEGAARRVSSAAHVEAPTGRPTAEDGAAFVLGLLLVGGVTMGVVPLAPSLVAAVVMIEAGVARLDRRRDTAS